MLPHEQQSLETLPALLRAHVPVPPDEQRVTGARSPWLYSTILGNGRMLVCLDETGSLAQLFYPHLDAGPHVHSFLVGIQVIPDKKGEGSKGAAEDEQKVSWLAGGEWTHALNAIDGAAAVHCVSTHPALHIQVKQTMLVCHRYDSFVSEISLTNTGAASCTYKFVIYAGFDIDDRQNRNTCYFDTTASTLAFFGNDRYISITCDRPEDGFDCGTSSMKNQDSVFHQASQARFSGSASAMGQVRGSVRYDLGQIDPGRTVTFQMHVDCGRSLDDLAALSALHAQPELRVEETVRWWREQYTHFKPEISSTTVRKVYNRSLLTLKLLTDAQTGGILAAPECDPDFRVCGGYGFCWPRDGAFVGHALDAVQHYDHARMFYDWALRVQEASGNWYQRYYMHGVLAPVYGLVQFDEIGAVVWSICWHVQLTKDLAYGQKVFPQLARACAYMQGELDAETGLAPVTRDLWEERNGISTYACACTWAAFNEVAQLSRKLGLVAEAEHWATAAARLKEAIGRYLWDASHQRFLRGLKTTIAALDSEQLRQAREFSEANIIPIAQSRKGEYMLLSDPTVDTSILGLSVPFGVFSASDPRMRATAEAVAEQLTSPVGGICRYRGDHYRGGNPWIICTLWLALQYMNSGREEEGYRLYNWALEHRTSLDLFAEQIDRVTDKPCWVIPLGWSHAMFLLATQECRKRGLLT